MKNTHLIAAFGGAVALGTLVLGYQLGKPAEASNAPAAHLQETLDEAAVTRIVRDYLLSNPEILQDVQAALETKQEQEQRTAQRQAIEDASQTIFNAPYDGIFGNPNGSVTIVEFFDYNCGYCKRAMADMEAMVAANPDLRFVLKEFPILGTDSQKAHAVSMAFRALMPERYAAFHRGMLERSGRADERSAIALALRLGADETALRKAMKSTQIDEALAETYDLANRLSITGTPSYVIGDEVVPGAFGQAALEEMLAQAGE